MGCEIPRQNRVLWLIDAAQTATNEGGLGWLVPSRVRRAVAFPWQGLATAVATHSRLGSAAQRPKPANELAGSLPLNRKQPNPACVTHSAPVLRLPGIPRVRSTCLRLSSRVTCGVKAGGAPSRKKWEQGGEAGISHGACAERALSMRPARGSRGLGLGWTGKTGSIPPQAEKGKPCPVVRSRGYGVGDPDGEAA